MTTPDSPIGGRPACPGDGPGCQTVGRHSLVARPPPPLTSPTPHSPIPKIYERGLREPWSVDLFCYLPDQESPWTDRSWTEIGLVDGNVLHIGECTLMLGKKVLQLHFLRNILHAQKIKSGFLDSSYAVSSVQKRAEFMFDDFANLNLHFT